MMENTVKFVDPPVDAKDAKVHLLEAENNKFIQQGYYLSDEEFEKAFFDFRPKARK